MSVFRNVCLSNSFCVSFKVCLSFFSLSLVPSVSHSSGLFLFLHAFLTLFGPLLFCLCPSLLCVLVPCFKSLRPLLTHLRSYSPCPLGCRCFWCWFFFFLRGALPPTPAPSLFSSVSLSHPLCLPISCLWFPFIPHPPAPPVLSLVELPFFLPAPPPCFLSCLFFYSASVSSFVHFCCISLSFSLFPSFFCHRKDSSLTPSPTAQAPFLLVPQTPQAQESFCLPLPSRLLLMIKAQTSHQ